MKRKLIFLLIFWMTLTIQSAATENNTNISGFVLTEDPEAVFFVIFLAVFIASILHQLSANHYFPFPYDPLLLILAILWGVAARYYEPLRKFCYIINIPSSIFRSIFLHLTVFQMAFSLDVFNFVKSLPAILIVTFPTHIIRSLVFTQISKPLVESEVRYDTFFFESFSYNFIDSRYSNEILRDIGRNTKSIRTLLEGESVCKFMQAEFFYAIHKFIREGENIQLQVSFLYTPIQFVVGYLIGKLGCMLMRKLYNDPVTLSALIIPSILALSLPIYLIHESYAIPLCFTIGFIMSLGRATSLTKETDEFVQLVLQVTLHIANIVNYLITGFHIALIAMPEIIQKADYVFIIVIFVLDNILRCVCFAIFSPLIIRVNKDLTYRKLCVCALSNLKHPYVLTLRLCSNPQLTSTELKREICPLDIFQTTSFIFSYFINAPLLPRIMKIFGFTKISLTRQINLDSCIQYIEDKKNRSITILKIDRFLADVNWDFVQKVTTLKDSLSSAHLESVEADILKYKITTNCPDCSKVLAYTPTAREQKQVIKETYIWVLNSMKVIFLRQYQDGTLSKTSLNYLLQAAEFAATKPVPLIQVKDIEKLFGSEGFFNKFFRKVLSKLYNSILEDIRPPRRPYRRFCYKIVTHVCFEPIVYFLIILNVALNLYDFITNPAKVALECALFIVDVFAFLIFFAEFMLRIFSYSFITIWDDGVKTFFSHVWNRLDFCILIGMLIALIVGSIDCLITGESSVMTVTDVISQCLKVFQILRLLRFARILKPFLPAMIGFFNLRIDRNIAFAYGVGKGYVTAQIEVIEILPLIIEDSAVRTIVYSRLEADRLEVTKLLSISQKERPWIAITVKTRQAIRLILNDIKNSISSLKSSGWVDDFEVKMLMASVNEKNKYLASIKSVKPSSPAEILKQVVWMGQDDKVFEYLLERVKSKLYNPGEIICEEGKVADGIYVVLTGFVNMLYTPTPEILDKLNSKGLLPVVDVAPSLGDFTREINDFIVSGQCIGELCFLTGRPMDCVIKAETNCFVYFLSKTDLEKAAEFNSNVLTGLRCRLWRVVGINFSLPILIEYAPYKSMTRDKVKLALERSFVPDLSQFKTFRVCDLIEDLVLLQGIVIDVATKEYFVAPCYIPRKVQMFHISNEDCDTKILIIPIRDADQWQIMTKVEKGSDLVGPLNLDGSQNVGRRRTLYALTLGSVAASDELIMTYGSDSSSIRNSLKI